MIIFFGLAGAGKSVQSEKLSEKIGWKHISAGAVLRAYDDPQVQANLKAGKLADYRITNRLIKQELDLVNNQMILDGYPRQIEQAEWIFEENRPIEICFLLEVSLEKIRERLKLRGRSDDTEEAILRRVAIFEQQTKVVLDYFAQKNVKIVKIDGNQNIDEVHEQIMQEVRNVFPAV